MKPGHAELTPGLERHPTEHFGGRSLVHGSTESAPMTLGCPRTRSQESLRGGGQEYTREGSAIHLEVTVQGSQRAPAPVYEEWEELELQTR